MHRVYRIAYTTTAGWLNRESVRLPYVDELPMGSLSHRRGFVQQPPRNACLPGPLATTRLACKHDGRGSSHTLLAAGAATPSPLTQPPDEVAALTGAGH